MIDISKLEPCGSGAVWLAVQTNPRTAWETCERSDWLLWLLGRILPHGDVRFRLAVCDIAASVLRFVPAGEDRPRVAIECARRHLAGRATTSELRAARSAAEAAATAYAGAGAATATAAGAATATVAAATAYAGAGAATAYAATGAGAAYAAYAAAAYADAAYAVTHAAGAGAANAAANAAAEAAEAAEAAARRAQNVANCDVLRKHFAFESVMAALDAALGARMGVRR
jgi:hypothetical protein